MTQKSNFELMATYNEWMNKNVYNAAATLNPSQLNENRGAFFGSILATLNHILVGDIIWLKRFSNHELLDSPLKFVQTLDNPIALDAILYPEFSDLRFVRQKMDDEIIKFTRFLTDDAIKSPLSYKDTKGAPYCKNFGHLIQHFFNHQTHHRGQVSTLFSQIDIDIGTTDLLVCIPKM